MADDAPEDIHSGQPRARQGVWSPSAWPAAALPRRRATCSTGSSSSTLARVPALAAEIGEPHFAWAGPTTPGTRHYYRVQGEDLLIEYDNTSADGNHAHTVLRRPRSDFGADLLARHRAEAHGAQSG